MRFVLAPVGSAGDVYPFVGLGLALRERGHQVVLMTSGYFAELAHRLALPFVDGLAADQFLAALQHPDLWHPVRGFRHVFQRCIAPHLRRHYELARELGPGAETCVLSSCLGMGWRLAQETDGIRLLTLHLQPSVMWSRHDSPQLPGMLVRGAPAWFRQLQFDLGTRWLVDPVAVPTLNRLRAELDLPPITSLLSWWNSPDGVVGLFPPWFAPPQPDWPERVSLTTFPLWTEQEQAGLSPDLSRFLDANDSPIVFTPGSAMCFGTDFFAAAVDAAQRMGRPAILATRFTEHLPSRLPTHIRHESYVPFRLVLPRAAAVVHHGGIGTTSQALAAGIPQLVMPMSHDQPDNAMRLQRLGVGDTVTPRWFTGRRVAQRLQGLLDNPSTTAQCQSHAQRLANQRPFDVISAEIEKLAAADIRR